MNNEEKMRSNFEAALGPLNFVLGRDSFGDYRLGGTQDAWTAWQAAIASVKTRDNEIAAKALDHASDHEDLYDKRDVLRRMAAELRS